MTPIFLVLTIACTDYEVHSLQQEQRANWFDEASERYRNDSLRADTGLEEDTGFVGIGDAIVPEGSPGDSSDDRDEGPSNDDTDADSSDESDGASEPGDSSDDGWDSTDVPPSGAGSARGPGPGEVIFTELMIYPRATDDNVGEWVELRNVGSVWMDLDGYRLGDRGVDGTDIVAVSEGSLVVAPGEYLTICADADPWENGGVECDGLFYYWTLGGGFALSNTEDEAQLLTPDGGLIDEVRYTEGFASEGDALGLRPSVISAIANDSLGEWCEQRSFLSFGDSGTPGNQNDVCW